MLSPAPAYHICVLAYKLLPESRKTNWDDMLLKNDITGKAHKSYVIPEVSWTVSRMSVFCLYSEIFMRKFLVLRSHIPFTETDFHSVDLSAENTVRGSNNPSFTDEGTSARYSLGEKALLYYGCHPRVSSKLSIFSTNNSPTTAVNFSTFGITEMMINFVLFLALPSIVMILVAVVMILMIIVSRLWVTGGSRVEINLLRDRRPVVYGTPGRPVIMRIGEMLCRPAGWGAGCRGSVWSRCGGRPMRSVERLPGWTLRSRGTGWLHIFFRIKVKYSSKT